MAWYGLTDPLDAFVGPLLDGRGQRALDLVDGRASVHVGPAGIEVRGLVVTRRARWSHTESIEVTPRLDVAMQEAVRLFPVARVVERVPLVGGMLEQRVDGVIRSVTNGPLRGVRRRLGRAVVRVNRPGVDVRFRRQLALLSLLRPEMSEHVLREAARHGVPVTETP